MTRCQRYYIRCLNYYFSDAKEGGIDLAWTGSQGLFVSIIVALLVTEVFRFFVQRDITIKMPDGVPPAVMKSFALVPAFVILIVTASIQLAVKLAGTSIHKIVFETIQVPLQGLAGTLPSAIIVALLIHVLWFFGLHGPNIVGGIIDPIYLPALEKILNYLTMVCLHMTYRIFSQNLSLMYMYISVGQVQH